MTTENVEREMYRGDSYVFVTQLRNADGTVFDLSPPSTKLWMTAKHKHAYADSDAVFQATNDVDGGITVTNLLTGEIMIDVKTEKTRLLPDAVCKLVYDIRVKGPSGRITTVETGIIVVKPSVTRQAL